MSKPNEVNTTGHEWDGIKEYDNPMPRWWLYTFYACIIWSIGYWVAYPAWPLLSGYTKGVLGYSSRSELVTEIEQAKAAQATLQQALIDSDITAIKDNPALLDYAQAGGRSAFLVNCSQCHGAGAQGFTGYPNLNDDDWLWGGKLTEIQQTITHGIRDPHDENTHLSDMPRFGPDGILKPDQINDVADYVLALRQPSSDPAAVERGAAIFKENCVICHGEKAEGKQDVGAPSLTDAVWLYGKDKEAVVATITYARRGVMPAWGAKLDAATIKKLSVYVHSLGGGQ